MDESKIVHCTCRCTCRSGQRNTTEKQSSCVQTTAVRQNPIFNLPTTAAPSLDYEKQRLICLMEAQSSQINRELKRLQVEGELTSAAIHAIRCGNEQHTYKDSSHWNTGASLPSENKKSASDPQCDSHVLQNPIPVHTCIAAHCRTREKESNRSTLTTSEKLANQYTCVCKISASKGLQSNDEVLSTELSTLRRRQEALAERIEKLQQCRALLLHNLNQLIKSGLTSELPQSGSSSNPELRVTCETTTKPTYEQIAPTKFPGQSCLIYSTPSTSNLPQFTPELSSVFHIDRECQTDISPEHQSQSEQVQTMPKLPDSSIPPTRTARNTMDLGKHPATVSALAAVAAVAAANFLSKAMNIQTPTEENRADQVGPTTGPGSNTADFDAEINWTSRGQKPSHATSVAVESEKFNEEGPSMRCISTVVPCKPHALGKLGETSPEFSVAQSKPQSSFMQPLCDNHLPSTTTNPLGFNSTPSTLQRDTFGNIFSSDLVCEEKNSSPEISTYPTWLGRTAAQRRRSMDFAERIASARAGEMYSLKFPPTVRSESHTPNIPRTAFSERLLIARKAVDEGKICSFRLPETNDAIHQNVVRRLREEMMDSEAMESCPMAKEANAQGPQTKFRMQKFNTHGLNDSADLPGKFEMTTGPRLTQTELPFVFRQTAVSTDLPYYTSRAMPVQVVKPAIRQPVALDSSGHDTGSPSDSTASMKSEERLSTFDPDSYTKRLSADSTLLREDRLHEQKPKSALVTEHKRTQRQHKYEKTGGPQRTVVWMDEICGDSSPNMSDGKRDSANETQESGSVRSNTQTYLYPEPDLSGGKETKGNQYGGDNRGFGGLDSVHIRPGNHAADAVRQQNYRRSLPDPRMMSKHWHADVE